MITIDAKDVFELTLTGQDLQAVVAGLGELPHKLAQPVEAKILEQIRGLKGDVATPE
jgi:hypothetical protein